MTPEQEKRIVQYYWHTISDARRGLRESYLGKLQAIWAKRPLGPSAKLRRPYITALQDELIALDERMSDFLDHQYGRYRLPIADRVASLAKAARSAVARGNSRYRELRNIMRSLIPMLRHLVFVLDRMVSTMLRATQYEHVNEEHIIGTLNHVADQDDSAIYRGHSDVVRYWRYRQGGSLYA